MLVSLLPPHSTARRVEREDVAEQVLDVHHAVVDHRRRCHRAGRARLGADREAPGAPERRHVSGVDLAVGVSRAVEVPVRGRPRRRGVELRRIGRALLLTASTRSDGRHEGGRQSNDDEGAGARSVDEQRAPVGALRPRDDRPGHLPANVEVDEEVRPVARLHDRAPDTGDDEPRRGLGAVRDQEVGDRPALQRAASRTSRPSRRRRRRPAPACSGRSSPGAQRQRAAPARPRRRERRRMGRSGSTCDLRSKRDAGDASRRPRAPLATWR